MKYLILSIIVVYSSIAWSKSYTDMKKEYESLLAKKYILLPHNGTFLNPISYNDNPNRELYKRITEEPEFGDRGEFNKHLETEFQISFLILASSNIFGTKINTFVGYTHHSFWQLYNEDWSRPFRETNYMPEFFGRYIFDSPMDILGFKLLGYDLGVVHQSNGQVQELSRSWNRIFSRFVFLSGKTIIKLALWHRLKETKKNDENPSIYKYNGYGEIDIIYKFKRESIELKIIPGTEHISGELGITAPWREGLRFYAKLSYGYGLSLQDYNHQNRKFGLGVILSNPFSSDIKNEP